MEMEELERREQVERYKEDMIKQIAVNTGHSAQMLRAMNWGGYATTTASLADDRNEVGYQIAETHMCDQEDEQQQMHDDGIDMMQEQLNQELRGGDNLAEGLAPWRFQPDSGHMVFPSSAHTDPAAGGWMVEFMYLFLNQLFQVYLLHSLVLVGVNIWHNRSCFNW